MEGKLNTMSKRITMSRQTRTNWLIDAAVFVGALLAALSGIYFLFLTSGGYQGGHNPTYGVKILLERHTWSDIHTWGGVLMIVAVVIHLALHWRWVKMMSKRVVTASFILMATGVALTLYALFVVACDVGGTTAGIFRTFGQNPLAAYLLHEMVLKAVRPLVPDNAPRWYCLVGFAVFFALTYYLVRQLEQAIARSLLGLARQTVWKMVERLVELGLLKKRRHPYDRRLVVLELTAEGFQRVRRAYGVAFTARYTVPKITS